MKQPITKKKALLRTLAFLLIVVLLYLLLTQFFLVNNETDTRNILGFYLEPKNSLDVILIGASELYTGFSSPMAWSQYGFTSYPLAITAAPGKLYSSMLTETVNRQKPKVVVVEINGFLYDDGDTLEEVALRKWIDNIPMSANKLATIRELVPKDLQYSFLCRMAKYHDNWKHPRACLTTVSEKLKMLRHGYSQTKSFYTKASSIAPGTEPNCREQSLNATNEQLLRNFCDRCKELGVEQVLFLRMPHRSILPAGEEIFARVNAIAAEYGYDFVSFDKAFDEIGLDSDLDFYNDEHMNSLGMEKFTAYFGQWLCGHYDVGGRDHSSRICAEWDDCVAETSRLLEVCKEKTLKNTGEIITEFKIAPES
ncbi:MAG: hypothetical protein PUB80_05670 [Clostridiales bacterium]|nr:hypothetical protein [Clostridiales bacterium]